MNRRSNSSLRKRVLALVALGCGFVCAGPVSAAPMGGGGKNIVTLSYGERVIPAKNYVGLAVVLEVQLDDYPGDPAKALVRATFGGKTYDLEWIEGKRVFDLTGPLFGIEDLRSLLTSTYTIEVIGVSSSVSTFSFNAQPINTNDVYTLARNLSPAQGSTIEGDESCSWLPPLVGPATPYFITCFLDPVELAIYDRVGADLPAGTTSWDPGVCLGNGSWDMRVEYLALTPQQLFTPLTVVSGSIVWSNHDWMAPGYPASGPAICTLSEAPSRFFSSGSACIGDINSDGVIGAADLALLLGAWGTPNPSADLNGDGNVSAADLALLLGNWS